MLMVRVGVDTGILSRMPEQLLVGLPEVLVTGQERWSVLFVGAFPLAFVWQPRIWNTILHSKIRYIECTEQKQIKDCCWLTL